MFLLASSAYLLVPQTAFAVCPVCTLAVGAGLGLSRYLGIDDSITGIWVGGLIISFILWTTDWVQKKNWKFIKKLNRQTIFLLSFLFWTVLTYLPLWSTGMIGHPFNTILGVDKLIFGSIIGAFAFIAGVWADKKVRKAKGRQLFNYQKVIFPVTTLIATSLVVYFYGGYLK